MAEIPIYTKPKEVCPQCESDDLEYERDLMWEETWYWCLKCGHRWCRG